RLARSARPSTNASKRNRSGDHSSSPTRKTCSPSGVSDSAKPDASTSWLPSAPPQTRKVGSHGLSERKRPPYGASASATGSRSGGGAYGGGFGSGAPSAAARQ